MLNLMLATSCLAMPITEQYDYDYDYECCCIEHCKAALSETERDRIVREIEWCTYRALRCLERAEAQIDRLTDINMKRRCKSALQGAVASVAASDFRSKALVVALTVIGSYLDDCYDYLAEAHDLVWESKALMCKASDLQDRLWRDR